MSIPTAVFLDTSILDGQQYNFQSTPLATFVPACKVKGVKLLLPEPTEQEVERHIRERSSEALAALAEARRKAPFLAKWPGLPQPTAKSDTIERLNVYSIARREWRTFLKQFDVVTLGYDVLDVKKVMQWYGNIEAPFREGKKRKEFPDAFAIAMLEAYALKERIYVAVVSADQDFRLACQRFNCLLYFASLPRLTEALLSDDSRWDEMRKAVAANIDAISDAIGNELGGLSAYHANDLDLYDVEFTEIRAVEPSIVAIGDRECTVSIYTLLGVEARVNVEVDTDDGPTFVKEKVRDEVEVESTAKISFPEGDGPVLVTGLTFDEYEVKLRARPLGW